VPISRNPGGPSFSISVVAEAPEHTIRASKAAERNGFDVIYVGDIQSTHRELYTSLALIASNTTRIALGPGVTNPVTRHPAVTAGAIATLDEIAPGRAFFGLGTGDSAVHNIGEKPATLAETEEYLRCVLTLWSEGETRYHDRLVRGRRWAGDIPVLMTAHGPKAFAMAGRKADAVVAGIGMTPEAVDYTMEHIEKGARESGRSIDDIDVWYMCYPHVGDSPDILRPEVGAALAGGGNLLAKSAAASTIPDRFRGAMTELAARYDYSAHMNTDPQSANSRLIFELGLVDYLAERFGLIGTPDDIEARIREHGSRGVVNYWCIYSRPDLPEYVDRWGQNIIARFRVPATA
jgi:5,10-methylenetetrahydromethanopterin reductase